MKKVIKINESQFKNIIHNIVLEQKNGIINEDTMSSQITMFLPKVKEMWKKLNDPNTRTKIMRCLTKYPNLKKMADISWNGFGLIFSIFLVVGSDGLLLPFLGGFLSTMNAKSIYQSYKDMNVSKLSPEFDSLKKCLGNI